MLGISYFFIHLLALILPGALIARLIGFHRGNPVFILAGGYSFYILLAALSKWQNLSLVAFASLYAGSFAVLAWAAYRHGKPALANVNIRNKPSDAQQFEFLLGGILLTFSYLFYRYIVGPYDEIPADVYRHLEYSRVQLNAIADGHLGSHHSIAELLKQQGGIWHSYYALISWLLGLELGQSLPWATLANGLIYLFVVYSFAWYLFSHFHFSVRQRLAAALLSAFFVASHLGINVFAYLRYYSLAPTMLNMVIYFAAVIAILEILQWRAIKLRQIIFLLFSVLAAGMVHNQEALYVAVMACLMLAWFAFWPRRSLPAHNLHLPARVLPYRLLLMMAAIGFFAMAFWAYTNLDRPAHFANKILQFSENGPILNRVLYLNPSFQAIQVITIWGLLVYGLFFIYWRKFIGHPYLFMGMLLPIFTAYNPVFVDWFMRLDGVHTLWRMLYIVPLHFVAAMLFVLLLQTVLRAALWRKALASFTLIALLALLLPLGGLNSNSRLTLAAVDSDERYAHWSGLLNYLNQAEVAKTSILTDPVTGYVLSGLSKHRTYQYKFLAQNMRQFNFDHYDDAPLAKYKNWLLVINDLGGGFSETGKYSRHWSENVLDTKSFYSAPLRAHIKANPDNRFILRWQQAGIKVYEIQ